MTEKPVLLNAIYTNSAFFPMHQESEMASRKSSGSAKPLFAQVPPLPFTLHIQHQEAAHKQPALDLCCSSPLFSSPVLLFSSFSSCSIPLSLLCCPLLFCSAPLFSFSGLLFSSVLFLCSALLLCSPPLLCSLALSTSCSVRLCLVKTRAIATARGRVKKTYFWNC